MAILRQLLLDTCLPVPSIASIGVYRSERKSVGPINISYSTVALVLPISIVVSVEV